jgi:hypothetical protein
VPYVPYDPIGTARGAADVIPMGIMQTNSMYSDVAAP